MDKAIIARQRQAGWLDWLKFGIVLLMGMFFVAVGINLLVGSSSTMKLSFGIGSAVVFVIFILGAVFIREAPKTIPKWLMPIILVCGISPLLGLTFFRGDFRWSNIGNFALDCWGIIFTN